MMPALLPACLRVLRRYMFMDPPARHDSGATLRADSGEGGRLFTRQVSHAAQDTTLPRMLASRESVMLFACALARCAHAEVPSSFSCMRSTTVVPLHSVQPVRSRPTA